MKQKNSILIHVFPQKKPKGSVGKVSKFRAGKTIPANKMNSIHDDEIKGSDNLETLCSHSSSTREIALVFKH